MKTPGWFRESFLTVGLRRSLAARLTLVYGLISLGVVTAMGVGIFFLTAHYLRDRARNDLASLAEFYAAYAAATIPDESRLVGLSPQIAGFFATQADYDVRLFNAHTGALLAATRDIGPLPSSIALAELDHLRPTLFLAASHDLPDRIYAARQVPGADGVGLAVIEVSRSTAEVDAFLSVLPLVLAIAGGTALLAALVASVLLARRLTRPLIQMESATQAIAGGNFERRLEVPSEDEIGRLAGGINRMAADLAHLETARREFIARISHDLRTPLTAIKGMVINLLDTAPDDMKGSLAVIEEQTNRLIRLVNDLLTLSRLQRGREGLRFTEIDLAEIVRSAVAIASGRSKRLDIALVLDLATDLAPAHGDADRLQQVVVNLLDNALKATPPGGTILVSAFCEESEVILIVSDSGPGLTEDEATRAFEPYVHGPGGGAGLGLTISREIIAAHGGRIWLRARPEGGAEAGFSVPVASGHKAGIDLRQGLVPDDRKA